MCISRWLTDIDRDLGVPAEQLWHVPLAVDHDLFNVGDNPPEQTIDIAALYNPNSFKGWDVALATLHELKARRSDLRAVIFGMEPPPQELPQGIEYLGFLTHRQLADDVYRKTRVYLQASWQAEGFGLTPVEAMCCGAALVTTDTGGSRNYAFHNKTALVTEPGDTSGLADAVEELLDDDNQRNRLASAGRKHCLEFDWDRSTETLEKHLESYLADPARYQQTPAEIPHPEET